MSDEEDEPSESEEEEEEKKPAPAETEAEKALKKRREAQKQPAVHGLDDAAKELLQANMQDRQRMDDEIQELRQRNERRKKEREKEEKRLAAERTAEEERRKTVEEDKRRKKDEEDDKKKKDRASKMAEFEKWKNPTRPNFVISKKSEDDEEEEKPQSGISGVTKKSKEQQETEKKAILSQRIVALKIDGFDQKKLTEKATELHKLIHRLEGEKYDYEQRFKAQQVDMMELAERARQANKVGRGGLKRIQVSSDDVDMIQARFSGAPAKVEMYSKYERQKDKRPYVERKDMYSGPQWSIPTDRIKPKKSVKFNDEGVPIYGVAGDGATESAK
jgi:troponin T